MIYGKLITRESYLVYFCEELHDSCTYGCCSFLVRQLKTGLTYPLPGCLRTWTNWANININCICNSESNKRVADIFDFGGLFIPGIGAAARS